MKALTYNTNFPNNYQLIVKQIKQYFTSKRSKILLYRRHANGCALRYFYMLITPAADRIEDASIASMQTGAT